MSMRLAMARAICEVRSRVHWIAIVTSFFLPVVCGALAGTTCARYAQEVADAVEDWRVDQQYNVGQRPYGLVLFQARWTDALVGAHTIVDPVTRVSGAAPSPTHTDRGVDALTGFNGLPFYFLCVTVCLQAAIARAADRESGRLLFLAGNGLSAHALWRTDALLVLVRTSALGLVMAGAWGVGFVLGGGPSTNADARGLGFSAAVLAVGAATSGIAGLVIGAWSRRQGQAGLAAVGCTLLLGAFWPLTTVKVEALALDRGWPSPVAAASQISAATASLSISQQAALHMRELARDLVRQDLNTVDPRPLDPSFVRTVSDARDQGPGSEKAAVFAFLTLGLAAAASFASYAKTHASLASR